MIDRILRGPKERMLVPFVVGPLRYVHPAAMTVLAACVGVLAALAAWHQAYGAALALWLLNRTLDGLDGTLARQQNRQSDLGGYLDMLGDTTVYAIIPLGIALSQPSAAAYLALALLLGSFYLNSTAWMYLSALLEKRAQGARTRGELTAVSMPGGLIEGAETVAFYCLFLLFPAWFVPLFGLMAALTLLTVAQRIVWAARSLRA